MSEVEEDSSSSGSSSADVDRPPLHRKHAVTEYPEDVSDPELRETSAVEDDLEEDQQQLRASRYREVSKD